MKKKMTSRILIIGIAAAAMLPVACGVATPTAPEIDYPASDAKASVATAMSEESETNGDDAFNGPAGGDEPTAPGDQDSNDSSDVPSDGQGSNYHPGSGSNDQSSGGSNDQSGGGSNDQSSSGSNDSPSNGSNAPAGDSGSNGGGSNGNGQGGN